MPRRENPREVLVVARDKSVKRLSQATERDSLSSLYRLLLLVKDGTLEPSLVGDSIRLGDSSAYYYEIDNLLIPLDMVKKL